MLTPLRHTSTSAMRCSSLPVELIRPIFQQIQDKPTLMSLCLSSKLLQNEAERLLYICPLGINPDPTQHMHLLTSLLNHPRLAPLVKTYHVMFVTGSQKSAFWTLVRSVLPLMVSLKRFSISAFYAELKTLPLDKLACQLEVLSWIQADGGDTQIFSRWLETQTALKELRWICRSPVQVSASACPNLTSLEGNFRVIAAILPNRPIKRLYWISDIAFKGCLINELGCDLKSLESLTFEKNAHAVDYRSLVDHLPSLTSLHVIGDGSEFIHEIPVPPTLCVLILSIRKGFGTKTAFPMSQRPAVIQKLFAEMPGLSRVDIASQLVGMDVFYERWECGKRREALVSWKDVLEGHGMLQAQC